MGYGGRAILPPLSLSIQSGEVWSLVGRNGSGKSTLARTVLGLQPPVSGVVKVRPDAVMNFVPQRERYDLSVPARAIDFVRGGLDTSWSFLKPRALLKNEGRVDQAVRDTEIESLCIMQFAKLSEGQKQRVLMARSLVCDPDFLVLDEPTSAMDPQTEAAIFKLIKRLCESRSLTIVVVSHQMSFVPRYADKVIFLDTESDRVLSGASEEILQSTGFRRRYGALEGMQA